jgi:hypothetical protein
LLKIKKISFCIILMLKSGQKILRFAIFDDFCKNQKRLLM